MNETLLGLLQGLIIIGLILLPFLAILGFASLNVKSSLFKILKLFICIFMPLIVILIGVVVGVNNFNINVLELTATWYYVISITWVGIGIILYTAMD